METLLYILRSIIALIVVIWLANIAIRYLNKMSNRQNKSIEIIERISVSKHSSLAIVKIVNDYYLMSFSEQRTEKLQKFSKAEAEEIEARLKQPDNFEFNNKGKPFNLNEAKETFTSYFERYK